MVTMKLIIHKARVAIDNCLDIIEINRVSIKSAKAAGLVATANPVSTVTETTREKSPKLDEPRGTKRQIEDNTVDPPLSKRKRNRQNRGNKNDQGQRSDSRVKTVVSPRNSGPRSKYDSDYFKSLHCKVCQRKGHDSLFYCAKFPEFIP